jgi:hypothetical protein
VLRLGNVDDVDGFYKEIVDRGTLVTSEPTNKAFVRCFLRRILRMRMRYPADDAVCSQLR